MAEDHVVIYAAPEQAGHYGDVVSAKAGGVYLDYNVVGAGFGGIGVADLELRRGAGLLYEQGLQSATPRAGWGRCSAVTLMVSESERFSSMVSGLSSANGVDARSR